MNSAKPIGVLHYGLGPIGVEVARLVASRPGLRSVAGIDVRLDLVGRSLGDVIGIDKVKEVIVSDKIRSASGDGDVVCLCTGSSLEQVAPQILECVELGYSVVSTCEELSYPWNRAPGTAAKIDSIAKEKGVAVLGTGVNPGFAMDYLPIVLSAASRRVDHVRVRRVQDAVTRRVPLQKKIGATLDSDQFQKLVGSGRVRHVGLLESSHSLGAAFGWRLSEVREAIEPVIAVKRTRSALGMIQPGRVAGVRQTATSFVGEREVVTLTLEMAVGLREPRDEIELRGDPDIQMIIPGGLHGDVATVAVVVNAIARIASAEPGLRLMADLAPPHP